MIKILTILGNNYGGCLQAYALQKKINDFGYDTEIINYTEYLNKKITLKKILRKIMYYTRNKKYDKFRAKYFNLGRPVKELSDDGSIYIVGSDQIWNQRIEMKYRKNFFLSFVKEKKRKNAYAASIGDTEIDSNEENVLKIREYLDDFNNISVREKSSIGLLKKITNEKIVNVLDPTLLLKKEEWDEIVPKKESEENILVYTLGLDKKNIESIDAIAKNENIKIKDIFYKRRFKNTGKRLNNLGPAEFVSEIDSSKFIITNSFHGTVFSIINHKEFFVITRGKMNSRIYDLLECLGIENRIIKSEDLKNVLSFDKFEKIDYEKVEKKLEILRNESLLFLKKILEVEK